MRWLFLFYFRCAQVTMANILTIFGLYVLSILADDIFLLVKLHSLYKMMFCNHSVQKVWTSRYYRQSLLYGNPPTFLKIFSWQYCSNEIWDKHKNKCMSESCFFMFRRLQNNIACFFVSNTFIYINRLRFDLNLSLLMYIKCFLLNEVCNNV